MTITASGLVLPNQFAHFFNLQHVRDDRGYADDVVLMRAYFFDKAIQNRKVQDHARGLDVRLDHHQPPTAMKHSQRKRPLGARNLVVI